MSSRRDPHFWKAQDISSSIDSPPRIRNYLYKPLAPLNEQSERRIQLFLNCSLLLLSLTTLFRKLGYMQISRVLLSLNFTENSCFPCYEQCSGDGWSTIMSRDRFFEIMQYILWIPQKSKDDKAYDPVYKLRPLISHLSGLFLNY